MVAKQLSIFLENKSGRLTEVTEVLAKENINLSLPSLRVDNFSDELVEQLNKVRRS